MCANAKVKLPEFEGEFRWGRYSEILQGVYATRIHLKQINHRVESLMERYTEPLAAWAWLAGADVPAGTQDLIWTAWRWLLKNHPHDDIYGSGIDPVHDEMLYRFSQAEQIGRFLVRDSLRQIARQVDLSAPDRYPRAGLQSAGLGAPRDRRWATSILTSTTRPPAISSWWTARARPVLHQVLADEPAFWMETLKPNRKRRVRVAFPAEVPACGYRAYYAQPRRYGAAGTGDDWRVADRGAENRYLAFTLARGRRPGRDRQDDRPGLSRPGPFQRCGRCR